MKYYSDRNLKHEIKTLKLGIVPAGDKRRFEFFVKNDTTGYLREIQFKISNNEVKVISAPNALDPGESGSLLVEWAPSITLKEGLDTQVHVLARALYGKV